MLTERALKRMYWPHWAAAFRANWQLEQGIRLVPARAENPPQLVADVQAVARTMAARDHRGMTTDDLRHATHHLALGRDISSRQMTSAQLDKLLAFWRRMVDPDNLTAALNENGAAGAAKRVRWVLSNKFQPDYLRSESLRIYRQPDWWKLTADEQARLLKHMRTRPRSFRVTKTQRKDHE